jgi:hypothetical protein
LADLSVTIKRVRRRRSEVLVSIIGSGSVYGLARGRTWR